MWRHHVGAVSTLCCLVLFIVVCRGENKVFALFVIANSKLNFRSYLMTVTNFASVILMQVSLPIPLCGREVPDKSTGTSQEHGICVKVLCWLYSLLCYWNLTLSHTICRLYMLFHVPMLACARYYVILYCIILEIFNISAMHMRDIVLSDVSACPLAGCHMWLKLCRFHHWVARDSFWHQISHHRP